MKDFLPGYSAKTPLICKSDYLMFGIFCTYSLFLVARLPWRCCFAIRKNWQKTKFCVCLRTWPLVCMWQISLSCLCLTATAASAPTSCLITFVRSWRFWFRLCSLMANLRESRHRLWYCLLLHRWCGCATPALLWVDSLPSATWSSRHLCITVFCSAGDSWTWRSA